MSQPFPPELLFYRFGASMDEWNTRARGWSRFGDWLEDLVQRGVSVNIGRFIGGSTVREFTMGYDQREPTARDLLPCASFRRLHEGRCVRLGDRSHLSSRRVCRQHELAALCEVVAAHRGCTSLTSGPKVIFCWSSSPRPSTRRARRMTTEIYHLKRWSRNCGKMEQAIARIDSARAAGLDVTADITRMKPRPPVSPRASLAGRPPMANFTKTSAIRPCASRSERRCVTPRTRGSNSPSVPSRCSSPGSSGRSKTAAYRGRSLAEIASDRGQDWVNALLDLLAAEGQPIFTVFFQMSEDNLALQMRQPWITFATDAGGMDPDVARHEGLQHPRAYGTYPRILGRYVRERGVLPLEDAIRKMTSAVADRLFLRDRGLLRAGMLADIVVFDPDTIMDRSTYLDPHQLSIGVRDVWVNGRRVLRAGAHTGIMPGRRLSAALASLDSPS